MTQVSKMLKYMVDIQDCTIARSKAMMNFCPIKSAMMILYVVCLTHQAFMQHLGLNLPRKI